MNCPTCDHPMEFQVDEGREVLYWCPRCGTIKHGYDGAYSTDVPLLPGRCIDFAGSIKDDALSERYGDVIECCLRPEERDLP